MLGSANAETDAIISDRPAMIEEERHFILEAQNSRIAKSRKDSWQAFSFRLATGATNNEEERRIAP